MHLGQTVIGMVQSRAGIRRIGKIRRHQKVQLCRETIISILAREIVHHAANATRSKRVKFIGNETNRWL